MNIKENEISSIVQEKSKGPEKSHWLLWWKISEEEIKEQVDNYKTYKIYQSAKGVSLLLTLLSLGLTCLLIPKVGFEPLNFLDVGLLVLFGFFIFLGHRWAMIAAMILWTLEKGYMLIEMVDPVTNKVNSMGMVMQVIFWCLYMKYFYLSFKTEQLKRKLK